jgi:hypothetical protein
MQGVGRGRMMGSTQALHGQHRRQLWLLVVAFFFLALAVFGLGNMTDYGVMLGRFASALLAVRFTWEYAKRKHIITLAASSRQRRIQDIDQLPLGRATSLQMRAGVTRPVDPIGAQVFTLAINNPAELRQRVVESYEPGRRTLEQRVTIDLQLPQDFPSTAEGIHESKITQDNLVSSDKPKATHSGAEGQLPASRKIPLPVVMPPKGELNDNLRVRDSGGALIPAFSYSEYLQVVASVLRMLLLKAFDVKLDQQGQGGFQKLPRQATRAEFRALSCIMHRGLQTQGRIERAVDSIRDLKMLELSPNRKLPDQKTLDFASELVHNLANRYAIVAPIECGPDGRTIVSYERTVVPELELARNISGQRAKWLKGRLSILFGTRPVNLSLRLYTATTCQSYHLVVTCPEGLFLRRQEIPGLEDYLDKKHRPKALIPPYYRLQWRLGQPFAHFYSRYFPQPRVLPGPVPLYLLIASCGLTWLALPTIWFLLEYSMQREPTPVYKVAFHETPPGSLFRATITAASSFTLILIVGLITSKSSNAHADIGTDAPAILLAFPAVIAAWLGFEAPSRRLLEGTLSARLSLIISAALAVGASALFMIYRTGLGILRGSIPFPVHISFLGITQTSWGVLTAIALINMLYSGYMTVLRAWEYKFLSVRHRSVGSSVTEVG